MVQQILELIAAVIIYYYKLYRIFFFKKTYFSDYILHSAVHAARPDIRCAIYVGCSSVVAVSALKVGLLPLTQNAAVLGEITVHRYTGGTYYL